MGTNSSNIRGIFFKIIPGLLLILFSFFMLVYYPQTSTSSTRVQKKVYLSTRYNNKIAKYAVYTSPKEQATQKIKSHERKAKKRINYKSSVPYKVKINRAENFVVIYGINVLSAPLLKISKTLCSAIIV